MKARLCRYIVHKHSMGQSVGSRFKNSNSESNSVPLGWVYSADSYDIPSSQTESPSGHPPKKPFLIGLLSSWPVMLLGHDSADLFLWGPIAPQTAIEVGLDVNGSQLINLVNWTILTIQKYLDSMHCPAIETGQLTGRQAFWNAEKRSDNTLQHMLTKTPNRTLQNIVGAQLNAGGSLVQISEPKSMYLAALVILPAMPACRCRFRAKSRWIWIRLYSSQSKSMFIVLNLIGNLCVVSESDKNLEKWIRNLKKDVHGLV